MPLLGQAAVVIWSEMADPAAHDDWHSHEHMPERIGIPGFLRARRMVALDGSTPRYFVLYEVADAAVMVSEPYLERLNRPTPWSQRTMAQNLVLNRTLCVCAASRGRGVGAYSSTFAFDRAADTLRQWVAGELLPALVDRPGLTAAHLLLRDASTQRPPTEEERLRRKRDASIDALLIVEGYDRATLEALAPRLAAELQQRGAAAPQHHLYGLAHLLAIDERSA